MIGKIRYIIDLSSANFSPSDLSFSKRTCKVKVLNLVSKNLLFKRLDIFNVIKDGKSIECFRQQLLTKKCAQEKLLKTQEELLLHLEDDFKLIKLEIQEAKETMEDIKKDIISSKKNIRNLKKQIKVK